MFVDLKGCRALKMQSMCNIFGIAYEYNNGLVSISLGYMNFCFLLLLMESNGSCVENRENTVGGIRHADHVAPSIHTRWQSLRRHAAVARSV
jgi:hypothetical protein